MIYFYQNDKGDKGFLCLFYVIYNKFSEYNAFQNENSKKKQTNKGTKNCTIYKDL